MSSLPSALRRSKEAWAAVGKPERARAVRQGDNCVTVGYDGTYLLCVDHAIATDWRAIVPKKPKAAGWPRYTLAREKNLAARLIVWHESGGHTEYYKSGNKCDGLTHYSARVQRESERDITAHEAAEWLYEHGFTEAAYAIEAMWEPEGTAPFVGDVLWHVNQGNYRFGGAEEERVISVTDDQVRTKNGRHLRRSEFVQKTTPFRILRRSRARRDLVAKVESMMRELGETK